MTNSFRLLAVLSLVILLPGIAEAGKKVRPPKDEPAFSRTEEVLGWINSYRQKPEPDRLPAMVKSLGGLGILRDLDQAGIYVGFTAGVLGSNSAKTVALVERMFPLPPEDQPIVIKAIAFSGLPNWKEVLTGIVERMPARKVLIEKYLYGDGKTLDELPLDEGGSFALDAHWGYFLATGSQIPVRHIIAALAWASEKSDIEKLTIGSMAKWTLATNATRDLELLGIMKSEVNAADDRVRPHLEEAILAAETFETTKIRKKALAAMDELKAKGPEDRRKSAWWGEAGQTALALGCVAASVTGHVELGLPCVIGGALSSAALKLFPPQ